MIGRLPFKFFIKEVLGSTKTIPLGFSLFTEMGSGTFALLFCLVREGRPRFGLAEAGLGLPSEGASALDCSDFSVFSCSGMC